jgi:WD40 repeat protein
MASSWPPRVAAAGVNRNVRLWEVASRQPRGDLVAIQAGVINGVAFSPDSKLLASASSDGIVRLWNVAAQQVLGTPLHGHASAVTSVAFSPDGTRLATGSRDKNVRVWNVDLSALLERACSLAGRKLSQAEWKQYVGSDTPYQTTCPDLPPGR